MTGLVQWHWLESRDVQERGEIAAAIVLSAVGLDLQRAVESLRDDDLTLHDDPLLGVNAMRGRSPDMRRDLPDQTNGEK